LALFFGLARVISAAKNRRESQQILQTDIKSIQNEQEQSTKLFDQHKSNNLFIFKCYYCNYETNVEREYERHVILRHPGKPAYPSKIDLEKMRIENIGS
jgi:hypothetical protein